jgi:hypothetical protein
MHILKHFKIEIASSRQGWIRNDKTLETNSVSMCVSLQGRKAVAI